MQLGAAGERSRRNLGAPVPIPGPLSRRVVGGEAFPAADEKRKTLETTCLACWFTCVVC